MTISTHMPLARHDRKDCILSHSLYHFYSHASCEAWLSLLVLKETTEVFLLTCLLRGMTTEEVDNSKMFMISTHMPLARHDCYILCYVVILLTKYTRQTLYYILFIVILKYLQFIWERTYPVSCVTCASPDFQIIMTPSGLYVFFAPICSTRRSQLLPK